MVLMVQVERGLVEIMATPWYSAGSGRDDRLGVVPVRQVVDVTMRRPMMDMVCMVVGVGVGGNCMKASRHFKGTPVELEYFIYYGNTSQWVAQGKCMDFPPLPRFRILSQLLS